MADANQTTMNDAQEQVLALLLRAHREVEQHLKVAQRWIPELLAEGVPALERFAGELESFGRVITHDLALHIAHEDKGLFPVLARYIGEQSGPIAVMLIEHRHLEGQEAQFRAGLKEKDPGKVANAAASIVEVLSAHMLKEENVLFPLSRRALRPDDWAEVLRLIQSAK